jgi:hypothetical protein
VILSLANDVTGSYASGVAFFAAAAGVLALAASTIHEPRVGMMVDR